MRTQLKKKYGTVLLVFLFLFGKGNAQLTGFEGYYHLDKDPNLYLQILVKNNQLVLKQLWDDREILFEQKSALYFFNEQQSFR